MDTRSKTYAASQRRGAQESDNPAERIDGAKEETVVEKEAEGSEKMGSVEENGVASVQHSDKADKTEDMSETIKIKESEDKNADLPQVVVLGHTDLADKPCTGKKESVKRAHNGQNNKAISVKRKKETPVSKGIPRGKPKSGRVWKVNKKRFSDMVRDRSLRTSWEVKMKERQEKKMVKSLVRQIEEDKRTAKEEKRKRREENLRRRLENERKAEVVQVINNPAKLKRARRKQLRSIEKRDTLMILKKQSERKNMASDARPKKRPSKAK